MIRARQPRAVNNVSVERIDRDVAIFKHANRMPFAKADLAIIAAAQCPGRTAFLLRAVHPIREAIVGGHVIKLGSWLVVPRAPRGAAIDADNRALISSQRNDLRIFFADPPTLVVVAARSALEAHKSFPAIRGFPRRGIGHINDIWIIGSYRNSHGARPTPADAVIRTYLRPGLPAIVGAVNSGAIIFCLKRGVQAIRLAC